MLVGNNQLLTLLFLQHGVLSVYCIFYLKLRKGMPKCFLFLCALAYMALRSMAEEVLSGKIKCC